MKITDVKTFTVWEGIRNLLVIKVETNEGIYGWGESGLVGREKAVQGAITHFRDFLIGQDARRLMPHNPLGPIGTAANIHLAAAVANYAWLEERQFDISDDVFPERPRLEGVTYAVPTSPGLGVEFNEEAADEPFEFWESPHLRRRDGSRQNW